MFHGHKTKISPAFVPKKENDFTNATKIAIDLFKKNDKLGLKNHATYSASANLPSLDTVRDEGLHYYLMLFVM